MFKNMSLGKMLGIFAGFLVVVLVGTVIAMKTTAKSQAQTFGHRVARNERPAQPSQTPAAEATSAQPAFIVDRSANTSAPVAPSAPLATSAFASTGASASTTPASSAEAVTKHLGDLDGQVSNLDTRVSAIEARLAPKAKQASTTGHAGRSGRRAQQEPKEVILAPTPLPGYKTMAIVNDRAWVAAPNGVEDNVVKGDELPRARVKTLVRDAGVVITTTDQVIEAH